MNPGEISITVLSDNHAAFGLEVEHGFSLWIEIPGCNILFDTGQSAAMLNNAESLGVMLSTTDIIAISHGHYDHTGNIAEVLRRAPQAEIYLHEAALCERYSIHEAPRRIGMPEPSVEAIRGLAPDRLHAVAGLTIIADGVWVTGPIPRLTSGEDTGGPFYLDAEGRHLDHISDDLALWIETSEGLVVCLGCCHSGIINTLNYIARLTGDRPIVSVIGGMHLCHASDARYSFTANALKEYSMRLLIPCHCTGDTACGYLAEKLGSTVHQGFAGMKQTFHTLGNHEEDSK